MASDGVMGGGFPAGQMFLGRDGKVFGPFTREQLDAMRATGELLQYHWVWDGSGQWVAANLPPPPPPVAPTQGFAPAATAPVIAGSADPAATPTSPALGTSPIAATVTAPIVASTPAASTPISTTPVSPATVTPAAIVAPAEPVAPAAITPTPATPTFTLSPSVGAPVASGTGPSTEPFPDNEVTEELAMPSASNPNLIPAEPHTASWDLAASKPKTDTPIQAKPPITPPLAGRAATPPPSSSAPTSPAPSGGGALFGRMTTPNATSPTPPASVPALGTPNPLAPAATSIAPPSVTPPAATPPNATMRTPGKPPTASTPSPTGTAVNRDLSAIRVVCFDRKRVLNGTLARVSTDGCVFALRLSVYPQKSGFVPGRPLWLNLVDEASGRSENVRAVLSSGTRTDGKLELKLSWDRLPSLLSAQSKGAFGA